MKRKQICEVTKAFEHVEVRIEITSQRPIDGVSLEIVKSNARVSAIELAKIVASKRVLSSSPTIDKQTMSAASQP